MRTIQSAVCALLLGVTVASGFAAPSTGDPDKDPQIAKLLEDARELIDSKKPAAAIEQCDRVIAAFKARYGGSKQKVYCARTGAETLGSLLTAAAKRDDAIALSSTWADAHFMKAYVLLELGRPANAKTEVQAALRLSPFNSQYLSELGHIYQLEKNWPKAEQTFEEAEDNAKLAPNETQADELGRARRGLAYVLVELGELDAAEKTYEQCLAADPNDLRAKRELEYVRGVQAKRRGQ